MHSFIVNKWLSFIHLRLIKYLSIYKYVQLFTTTQDLYCIQLLKHAKARCLDGQQANHNGKKDISMNFYDCLNGLRQEL